MVRNVKFTQEVDAGCTAECSEKLATCKTRADIHVCFEDGSGKWVCRKCFDQRVNDGDWITDAAEHLLAS